MIVTRDDAFKDFILKRMAERELSDRSGVHSTDLVYCLNKQALRKVRKLAPTEDEQLRYAKGYSTQRWLTGTFEPDTAIELDGIVVTPDTLVALGVGDKLIPWELKSTDQSSGKPVEENIAWIKQIMAQCKVTNSLTAKLSRLENMGDWAWVFPRGATKEEKKANKLNSKHPTLSAWNIEFTQEEIDGNWEWLKRRREDFLTVREGFLLPRAAALATGQEWECEYCPFNGVDCK